MMDQQSAFAMYKKSKQITKAKQTRSLKLKKIHKKKKHLVVNINSKELNGHNNEIRFKKLQKKRTLHTQPNELNANKNNNYPKPTVPLNQTKVGKGGKDKQKKELSLDFPNNLSQSANSDDEIAPTLIKMSAIIKHTNTTNIEKKLDKTSRLLKTVGKPKQSTKKVSCISSEDQNNVNSNGENALETAKRLLQWIIQPTSVADFFENCWEKAPLYVKRKNNKYFAELFSSDALDAMLRNNSLFFKTNVDIAIYKDGLRQDADTEGRAYPSLVWDHYNDGHTIRISDPQTYDSKLRSLLSALQEYFGCFVGSNIYLTPPDSQGFAPHYDDIEAFIIQVEGRKHWKLYSPPTDEDVLARESSGNYPRSSIKQLPLKEITLNAGDVLYFPRGTVHEGHTDAESHSLHITVSTYQKTAYADLLETVCTQAMQKAFKSSVEYRRGLPIHYLRHAGVVNTGKRTEIRKEFMKTVHNLFQGLWEHVDVDSAVDVMGRKFMHESLAPQYMPQEIERTCVLDGDHLIDGRVVDKAEMNPDTNVRLLRYHCIRLLVDKCTKEAKIYYNVTNKAYKEVDEQFLIIDLTHVPIIESLQEAYPQYMSIESIPHENLEAKLNVVQVLWQYGLIVTETKIDLFAFDEDDDDGDVQMTTQIVDSNEESDSESDEEVVPIPKKLKKKN